MPLEHSKLGVIFNLDSQTWTVTIERGDPASCSTKEEAAEERKYLKRETRERDRPRGYSRRLPRTIQPLSPSLTHFSPLPCLSRGRAKRFPPRFKGIPLGNSGPSVVACDQRSESRCAVSAFQYVIIVVVVREEEQVYASKKRSEIIGRRWRLE